MPDIDDAILFIEDDADDYAEDVFLLEFDRNLESLLQCCKNIKGIIFGRFQQCSNMNIRKLKAILKIIWMKKMMIIMKIYLIITKNINEQL